MTHSSGSQPEEEAALAKAQAVAEAQPEEVPVRTRELASKVLAGLMQTDKRIRAGLGTMIASRQLYAICVRELEQAFAAVAEESKKLAAEVIADTLKCEPSAVQESEIAEVTTLLDEVCIQVSAHEAGKVFDEIMVMHAVKTTLMPWLEETMTRHSVAEEEERAKRIEEADKLRRERPVPLGLKFDLDVFGLDRKKSLIFFGWGPAVRWVLDQITSNVLKSRDGQLFSILRLMTKAPKDTPHRQLLRFGGQQWKNCGQSHGHFHRFFQGHVIDKVSDAIDLLMVDDLPHAYQSSLSSLSSPARRAGLAHKTLRKHANDLGAALIGGIPLDEKVPPPPLSSDWEQLKAYTLLRPLTVTEASMEHYKITIGTSTAFLTVSKDEIDAFNESKLILPK